MTAGRDGGALTPYVPRLLVHWEDLYGATGHQAIEGTLVFADVSGFTRLSEALARTSGKAGAEELADVIDHLFGELLILAAVRGGEMLKYGGDAMLLFFSGGDHALRAAAACADMQSRLREVGKVDTRGSGLVRLRMSVGAHSGSFDFFVGGRSHTELLVAGPATTVTVAMEAEAEAGEVLLSTAMAAVLPTRNVGPAKGAGYLLRGHPRAPLVETAPLDDGIDASPFLAPSLITHLSSGGAEAAHRLVTVAFVQFSGLDQLLRGGKSREAARRIDDLLTLVQESFLEFDVTFLATDLAADGGKVMAAAGAPVAHPDSEERMLRACRRILDSGPALPVRIGVNRGHVFAADVGPRFRRTYTTLGDVTNTAARVMARAGRNQLLALRSTIDAAASEWETDRLDPFLAKGKALPLVPYSVGQRGQPRVRHASTGRTTPFVGRDLELATLRSALDDVRSTGEGRVVRILGRPGLGKTTLVEEFTRSADAVAIHAVAGDQYAQSRPYAALRDLVAELLAGSDRHDPADAGLLRGAILGASNEPAADETTFEDLQAAFHRLLTSMPAPAVVVIEDLHWLDEGSLALMQTWRARRRSIRALVCETSREGREGHEADIDVLLTLAPLDAETSARLIRAVAHAPLAPRAVAQVAARASGNPLYLRELILLGVGADDHVPDTVEAVIAARIDRLPRELRATLRTASVVGARFSLPVLEAVRGPLVATELDELGDYIEPVGSGWFRFNHALVREVAYGGLPYRRRRAIHTHVVSLLEQETAANEEDLALHAWMAGDHERSWRWCQRAAVRAFERLSPADAAVLYERAAEAGERTGAPSREVAQMWLRAVETRFESGQAQGAIPLARRARRKVATVPAVAARVAYVEGRALAETGAASAAAARYRAAIAAAREARPRTRTDADDDLLSPAKTEVRALLGWAYLDVITGRFTSSAQRAREAAELARSTGDRTGEGHAASAMYVALSSLRDPAAESHALRAMQIFEAVGDHIEAAVLRLNMGGAWFLEGRWREAVDLCLDAHRSLDAQGLGVLAGLAANNAAEVLLAQGRVSAAIDLFEYAHSTLSAAGHQFAPIVASRLGWASSWSGDHERAEALLASSIDALEARFPDEALAAGCHLAESMLLRGEVDEASALIEKHPAVDAIVIRLEAWVQSTRGDVREVEQRLRAAVRRARDAGSVQEELFALAPLAAITADASIITAYNALATRLGVVAPPPFPAAVRAFATP